MGEVLDKGHIALPPIGTIREDQAPLKHRISILRDDTEVAVKDMIAIPQLPKVGDRYLEDGRRLNGLNKTTARYAMMCTA